MEEKNNLEEKEVNNELTNEIKQEQTQNELKKKGNKLAILLTIVGILLIAAAIVIILLPKSENKNSNNTDNNVIDDNTNTVDDNTTITERTNLLDYRMMGNSIEKFDLYFLKLENEAKNKVYSPLSIKYALEMLSEGANGESKKQLDTIIGSYQTKKYTNDKNKSFANAMFVRDSFKDNVKDEYKNTLSSKYNAEIINDSFENPDKINKWISDKTLKLIPNLIDDVSQKDFFLVNALAIDMEWNNQIHCASGSKVPCLDYYVEYPHEKVEGDEYEYFRWELDYMDDTDFASIKFNGKDNIKGSTVVASFNRYDIVNTLGEDNIRQIVGDAYDEWLKTDEAKGIDYTQSDKETVLNKYIEEINKNYGKAANSTDFMLYVDDNIKAFAKDLKTYNGSTLQYIGIMPKNIQLTEYVNNVSVEDINTIINNLKDMKIENFKEGYVTLIEGDIPLFKYEYELSLMEDLQKLGITDVFDSSKADLSGMLKESEGVSIVDAKHKATIEFSNDGIKAAAVTAEGGAGNTGGGFNYLFEVPTERIDITFDNPYLYLIRDKDSGEVWFIGTVYEPITK